MDSERLIKKSTLLYVRGYSMLLFVFLGTFKKNYVFEHVEYYEIYKKRKFEMNGLSVRILTSTIVTVRLDDSNWC